MKTKEWNARRPQHLVARIVCVLLAVIAWLCVMRISDPVCDGTLNDVSVTVVDTNLVAYTGILESDTISRVRIRATKEKLAAIQATEVSAFVNMADLQSVSPLEEDGTYEMTVYFKTPEGISIDGNYTVTVRLQEKG